MGNSVVIRGRVNTTGDPLDGQDVPIACDANGNLAVSATVDESTLATATAQAAGNALLTALVAAIAPLAISAKQPALGAALASASIPITVASDQSAIPMSAASLPLPTGAAVAARQPALGSAAMAASTPVTIASDQTAVPVSAASLPLPVGAATAAKQPALGTAAMAAATPVTIATDDTRVVALGTLLAAGNASAASVDSKVATASNQTTANASLGSIDTKLSSQATAANQSAANTSLASIDGKLASLGSKAPSGSVPVALPISVSFAHGQKSANGTAAALAGSATYPGGIWITNTHASALLYVGNSSGVLTTTGHVIPPLTMWFFQFADPSGIYVITDGTTIVATFMGMS